MGQKLNTAQVALLVAIQTHEAEAAHHQAILDRIKPGGSTLGDDLCWKIESACQGRDFHRSVAETLRQVAAQMGFAEPSKGFDAKNEWYSHFDGSASIEEAHRIFDGLRTARP